MESLNTPPCKFLPWLFNMNLSSTFLDNGDCIVPLKFVEMCKMMFFLVFSADNAAAYFDVNIFSYIQLFESHHSRYVPNSIKSFFYVFKAYFKN